MKHNQIANVDTSLARAIQETMQNSARNSAAFSRLQVDTINPDGSANVLDSRGYIITVTPENGESFSVGQTLVGRNVGGVQSITTLSAYNGGI